MTLTKKAKKGGEGEGERERVVFLLSRENGW
jgi:hypothetical protein